VGSALHQEGIFLVSVSERLQGPSDVIVKTELVVPLSGKEMVSAEVVTFGEGVGGLIFCSSLQD